jgi:hypothetical protein
VGLWAFGRGPGRAGPVPELYSSDAWSKPLPGAVCVHLSAQLPKPGRVSASPDAGRRRRDDPWKVKLTPRERAAAVRQAKLDHIDEQVAAGDLVIRAMTKSERRLWARQHAAIEAKLTLVERTRRATALKARRSKSQLAT